MDVFFVSILSAVPFDPNGLLVAASQDVDQIELVLQSPSVVSAAPHEGAGWSESLEDVFGLERPWRAGDPGMARLWLPKHGLPTDMRCWLAVTAGPVGASSLGVAIGLQGTATGQQVVRGINTGAGWTVTVPAGKSPGTVGVQMTLAPVGALTAVVVTAIGPEGTPLPTANLSPSVAAGSALGPAFDTLTTSCGWATGVGGTAGVSARVHGLVGFLSPGDWGGSGKDSAWAADGIIAQGHLGQSNMLGPSSGSVDTTWSGASVPAADLVQRNGIVTTTWPARPGPQPYLLVDAHAAAAGNAAFILRAVSGTDISTLLGSHLPNLVGDYYRLAPDAPPAPGVVVIVQGEADAQVLAKAQAYEAQLDLAVNRIHAYWPAAPIVVQELVTTAATYPYHEVVRIAQNAVAARYDYVALSESEGLPTVADGVHLTPGTGGGYDQMAERITAAALEVLP